VELESGELVRARTVISNADPKRVLKMVADEAMPADYRERLESWQVRSPVVKVNAALSKLPSFTAAGSAEPHRAMVSVTPGLDAAQLPERLRPERGAAGRAHDERLRPVRAL
jgi:phytoene dehydrogenase-like protein